MKRQLSASTISYLLACVFAQEGQHLRVCETCGVDPQRCDERRALVEKHKAIQLELMPDRRRGARTRS